MTQLTWRPETRKGQQTVDNGVVAVTFAGQGKIAGYSGGYKVCVISNLYHDERCVSMSVKGAHVAYDAWFSGKNEDRSLKCLSETGVTPQTAMDYAQEQWDAFLRKAGLK